MEFDNDENSFGRYFPPGPNLPINKVITMTTPTGLDIEQITRYVQSMAERAQRMIGETPQSLFYNLEERSERQPTNSSVQAAPVTVVYDIECRSKTESSTPPHIHQVHSRVVHQGVNPIRIQLDDLFHTVQQPSQTVSSHAVKTLKQLREENGISYDPNNISQGDDDPLPGLTQSKIQKEEPSKMVSEPFFLLPVSEYMHLVPYQQVRMPEDPNFNSGIKGAYYQVSGKTKPVSD